MLRWLEGVGSLGLALLIFFALLIAGAAPEGGESAVGGAGGQITMIASPEIEQLVQEWRDPPAPDPEQQPPTLTAAPLDLPGLRSPEIDREPPPQKEPEKKEPEKKVEPKKKPKKKPRKASVASPKGAAGRTTTKREASGRGRAAAGGTGRASASLVRAWGSRIRADISRSRRYPSAAKRRKEQGRVVLRLKVSRGGALISASVSRSSGSRLLDQAALKAARRAAPYPSAPSGLTNASYRFAIPVVFKVR